MSGRLKSVAGWMLTFLVVAAVISGCGSSPSETGPSAGSDSKTLIIGTWVSDADANVVWTFYKDGGTRQVGAGGDVYQGKYELTSFEDKPALRATADPGSMPAEQLYWFTFDSADHLTLTDPSESWRHAGLARRK